MLKFIKISLLAIGATNGHQLLTEEDATNYITHEVSRRNLSIFDKIGHWVDKKFGEEA